MLGGQAGDGRADGGGVFAEGEGVGRIGWAGFIVAEIGREGFAEQLRPAPAHADAVDGAVAGEGDGPGEGGAAAGLELAGLFPKGDKHVLHDVLGLLGVVQDAQGGGVKRTGETIIKRGKGIAIAAGNALQQLGVPRVAILGGG